MSEEKSINFQLELLNMIPAQPGIHASYKRHDGSFWRTSVVAWGGCRIWETRLDGTRALIREEYGPLVYVFGYGIGPAAHVPYVPSLLEEECKYLGIERETGSLDYLWTAKRHSSVSARETTLHDRNAAPRSLDNPHSNKG